MVPRCSAKDRRMDYGVDGTVLVLVLCTTLLVQHSTVLLVVLPVVPLVPVVLVVLVLVLVLVLYWY
jgi:hypothetical protein